MAEAWLDLVQTHIAPGAVVGGDGDQIQHYGDPVVEHAAIRHGAALVARTGRALLEVTGADRAAWLHNLTTNEVNNIGPGEGNYAFALNVKGRILFDLNMLVREDGILVDLDRRLAESARKHFDKYTITEDVTLSDRTGELARIGVTGPQAPDLLTRIGLSQIAAMPDLGTTELTWSGHVITVIRHDFCGPIGVELLMPIDAAAAIWQRLATSDAASQIMTAGEQAVRLCRIEFGIPAPPHEINDDVLPAETRQLERAVSYQKGCFLGQEVVERMRSRGVVARGLRGLRISADVVPAPGTPLVDDEGQIVGTSCSACRSPAFGGIIALAYIKTGKDAPSTVLSLAGEHRGVEAIVEKLPFAGAGSSG